jgi:CRISPR-associated protein Csb1
MEQLSVDRLIAACGDDSFEAGLSIVAELEPVAGSGAPVKPAIYEGGKYQHDKRWVGEGDERELVDAIVIDNVPSQANRLEQALRDFRGALGLPVIELDLSMLPLPVHLSRRLTSFDFPHRNADAYLRDAEFDGVKFPLTEVGAALFAATPTSPEALFRWMPQALLFGFWQSHLGKKNAQTKLARSWTSEIVGLRPAWTEGKQLGLKGDPLNLSVDEAARFDENDVLGWELLDEAKSGKAAKGDKGEKKERLSEIGHGQVPVGEGALAVSFARIQQRSTVAFSGLRRIHCSTAGASAAGRALLTAIGVAAHVAAFGRAFSLRSGADLRPVVVRWTWLGSDGASDVAAPSMEQAVELVRDCAERAHRAGLPVGPEWPSDPLVLVPQANLRKAIEKTWPADEDDV